MKPFVRRWVDWPLRDGSELSIPTVVPCSDTSEGTGTQCTDRTDKTPFGSFVSSLPRRSVGSSSPALAATPCAECRRREAMGVTVVGCAVCGFRHPRGRGRRLVTGRARRAHRATGHIEKPFRLVDGGGGDDRRAP